MRPMPTDDQLRADLADFTVRLERRLSRIEADLETTRRLALDALDTLPASEPYDPLEPHGPRLN